MELEQRITRKINLSLLCQSWHITIKLLWIKHIQALRRVSTGPISFMGYKRVGEVMKKSSTCISISNTNAIFLKKNEIPTLTLHGGLLKPTRLSWCHLNSPVKDHLDPLWLFSWNRWPELLLDTEEWVPGQLSTPVPTDLDHCPLITASW